MNDPVLLLVLLLAVLAAAALGAWGGWRAAWQVSSAELAAATTESDLLREQLISVTDEYRSDRALAASLAPLSGTLARVEQQVSSLERDRLDQFARLDAQLTEVRASGEALRVQTSALAGALRNPTARGAWGEVQLKRVVEHAGMLNRVDFETQVTGRAGDGSTVRPDLVVHLPGRKHVVVDAKAPLAAFLEASEAGEDPARQQRASVEHAKALRGHVDTLARKEYWTAFTPTPELVICFVPGEAFLASACTADPTLLEYAMNQRVVLATPTTLLALLRTVALTWQTEALSGSARELFELGRELYSRLGTLGDRAGKLGRTLSRAIEDYNAVIGSLENSVLVKARRMAELDVTDLEIAHLPALEISPRPLSAPELIA